MRIGIFGGTFNPVHNEHIKVAVSAVEELKLDKLFIVPTFIPPHKDGVPAPATDRIAMLSFATAGLGKIEISDFEIQSGGKSYSYITAEHFKNEFKDAEIFFIMGADMFSDFKFWKNPERIVGVCTLAVFSREDFPFDYEKESEYISNKFGGKTVLLSYKGKSDSSTKIRVYASLGLPLVEFTDKRVALYIEKNGLYKGGEKEEFIKKVLTEKRLIHTANVVVTALKKVKELNLDYNKVYTGALLHDVAKYLDYRNFKDFKLPEDIVPPVVHSFLGAYVAENLLGIDDEEILGAIRYHTSGKPEMSTLEKLIFVADMVEEGRTYEGVETLRALYEKDLNECFTECLKEEVVHLKNKGAPIFPLTLKAYEYYIGEKNGF